MIVKAWIYFFCVLIIVDILFGSDQPMRIDTVYPFKEGSLDGKIMYLLVSGCLLGVVKLKKNSN